MSFNDLQSAPDLILEDGTKSTVCDRCREIWGRSKKEPPCESCRVELKWENEEAARIYQMIRMQCQTRWNGERDIEIDLDFNAVFGLMDRYPGGIKDQWEVFNKVRNLFHHFLNEKRGE